MTPRPIDPRRDPVRPEPTETVDVAFEGRTLQGARGQTVAGLLMANGVLDWRTTSANDRPRGLFCGIGVCFDCVVVVDGERDVRACQRRVWGGERLERQHDLLPGRSEED